MIFVVIEQMISSDMTIGVRVTGIDAEKYEDAKNILKTRLDSTTKYAIITETPNAFEFKIEMLTHTIFGRFKDKPMEILKQ
jgi:hypothetical protein